MATGASHRFVDHTSEIELELHAPTREGALAEAAVALGELLGREEPAGEPAVRELSAEAPDDAALLAAWLEELVFLAEDEGFVPHGVETLTVGVGAVTGRVSGAYGSPPHLVKGVTYHRLELSRREGMWRGRAVLDV